jgi:ethanolamine utilization protein EutA (predicted chaperonin)
MDKNLSSKGLGKMGYWQLKDGRKIEMIFDQEGNFIKFGENITDEEVVKITKEINDTLKEDNII